MSTASAGRANGFLDRRDGLAGMQESGIINDAIRLDIRRSEGFTLIPGRLECYAWRPYGVKVLVAIRGSDPMWELSRYAFEMRYVAPMQAPACRLPPAAGGAPRYLVGADNASCLRA